MKIKYMIILLTLLLIVGCTVGSSKNIRLRGNVNPAQISLDKKVPVFIEANVENIGNSTETVSLEVDDTEGLSVEKPKRTSFTLQPGESRIISFTGILDANAVPGKYRVEILAKTENSGRVSEVVFINVVAEKGFI
jgi:uncharacterized membrane protein